MEKPKQQSPWSGVRLQGKEPYTDTEEGA